MSDFLPIFDDETTKPQEQPVETITESQRIAIRGAFVQLGIVDARGQFEIVEELTGHRITAVAQLEARHAQTLIYRLGDRVKSAGRKNTGNAWDDREEDTWIDKL